MKPIDVRNSNLPPLEQEDGCKRAMQELRLLFEEAWRREIPDANGVALATASKAGRPSVRIVYVLAIENSGLVFFANSNSGKGQQMQDNPRAGMCYFWPTMQVQVAIEGSVELLSGTESDAYWRKRPRETQLAAWASEQTESVCDRGQLKKNLTHFKGTFDFDHAPRPAHWRAYRLRPDRVEFWNTGWRRLLARRKYEKLPDGQWNEQNENP